MFEGIFPKKKAATPEKKEASSVVRGPIFVCAESFGLLDFEDQYMLDQFPGRAEYVDFYGEGPDFRRRKQISSWGGYVLSIPSEDDKFSRDYANCSGIVVVGVDAKTGKNLSILTHENPSYIFGDLSWADRFKSDLQSVCKMLYDRAEPGSIDAVIFGGDHAFPEQYGLSNSAPGRKEKTRHDDYIDMVEIVADSIREVCKIEPVVALGPRTLGDGATDAFFDTQHRRLYLTRKKNPDADQDFPASGVREHMDARLRKMYPGYYEDK